MPKKRLSPEYISYLQTEHWQALRESVLTDARGKPRACAVCFNPDGVQAHHIVYRHLYDCTPADLIPLCDECHQVFHIAKDEGSFSSPALIQLPESERRAETIRIIIDAKERHGFAARTRDAELNRSVLHEPKKSARFMDYATYQRRMV